MINYRHLFFLALFAIAGSLFAMQQPRMGADHRPLGSLAEYKRQRDEILKLVLGDELPAHYADVTEVEKDASLLVLRNSFRKTSQESIEDARISGGMFLLISVILGCGYYGLNFSFTSLDICKDFVPPLAACALGCDSCEKHAHACRCEAIARHIDQMLVQRANLIRAHSD